MADSRVIATPPRRRRRPLLVLLVGIGGATLGLAILTAMAHPAAASELSTGPSALSVPRTPSASIPVAEAVAPLTTPAVPALATVLKVVPPAVSSTVEPLPDRAVMAVGAPAIPGINASVTNVLGILTIPPSSPLPTGIPTAGLGPSLTPAGRATSAEGPVVAGSATTASSSGQTSAQRLGYVRPSPSPVPFSPNPSPTSPLPSPIAPLTAIDASSSSPSQGTSPFASLPPSSLLLPVLALGSMIFLRGKRPRLLFDARCSPPG